MSLYKELANYQAEEIINKKVKRETRDLQYKGFTFEDIEMFLSTMYETHELAMKKFLQRNSDSDGEILVDSMLAIRHMEQIKRDMMLERL